MTPRWISRAAKSACEGLFPRHLLGLRRDGRGARVAVTFDDGPHPVHTEQILRVLREEQVAASFFLVGKEIEKYPGLAKQIAAEGHDVGNHSFSHGRVEGMNTQALREEIARTEQLIRETTGSSKRLFRPPYGTVTIPLLRCAWREQLTVVLWSLDSGDSAAGSDGTLHDRLRAADRGDIILLHEDYAHTAAEMRGVLRSLKEAGLGFARVSEWVGQR